MRFLWPTAHPRNRQNSTCHNGDDGSTCPNAARTSSREMSLRIRWTFPQTLAPDFHTISEPIEVDILARIRVTTTVVNHSPRSESGERGRRYSRDICPPDIKGLSGGSAGQGEQKVLITAGLWTQRSTGGGQDMSDPPLYEFPRIAAPGQLPATRTAEDESLRPR